MKEQNNINKERIKATMMALRLFSGDLPKAEYDRILAYFVDDEDVEMKEEVLREVFMEMLHAGRLDGRGRGAGHDMVVWPRLVRILGIDPAVARPASTVARKSSLRTWTGRVAAAVVPVAMALGGFFVWDMSRSGGENEDVVATAAVEVPATFRGTHTISAPADSVRNITLSDGTQVMLNSNSTLAYNDSREAELSGEAYFEVAKDSEHPFIIYSDGLKVAVLGTEFNFDTDTDEGSSKLSLYEGHVMLADAATTYDLDGAGCEFVLDHATGFAEVHGFDATQKPQWMMAAGVTASDILSLGAILDLIENRYGVTVVNRGAVNMDVKFKFDIDPSKTLENIMMRLEYIDGEFAYQISGTTITLTKKQKN